MAEHLVVIGAQRSGTTSLADLLEAHPQIALARPRRPEPKVFLDEEILARGAEWYLEAYFPHRAQARVLAEKSTSYLDHPEAIARVVATLDAPRVLAQLRDPVARAVSHWRFSSEHGVEERPLVDALRESLTAEAPWDASRFSTSPFAYLSRGRYAESLRPWLDAFGERGRVQFLEEDGAAARRSLFGWLGVDPAPAQYDPPDPANASAGPAPELPAGLVARLRDYFEDSDQELRDLVGRGLPWDGARGSR